ncbi:TonB-dependent receptor [Sphingomonas sp. PB4P5]|uniref:TonB-dependent receptor n=1 Tax=Parasphingomonas puruogangriensis TaxID=3096155 RepID=UPI002FC9FA9D
MTGYRQSLRTAINEKRNADRVQEVLSAEDIGKLPEASIAESLARLPGLATNRDRGNGTQVSIRGMGPALVNTLLNGREIVSSEPSRNIRYEQYPAELLSGAFVFKSPTAAQVEGAIAGQIDLRTIRPLDYKERKIVLNVRGIYSDLADNVGDTKPFGVIGSISYIDQFADDTLGIALGYSGRRQAVATERTNVFRYTNSFADLNGDGQGNDNIPYGYEALQRGGDDIRHGALAAVQWKPGDGSFELNGDFFYSKVKFNETQRGFRVEDLPFGNSFANATVTDGGVTAITATNAADFGLKTRVVNEYYFLHDDLYAGGLNAKYRTGGLTLTGDAAYSRTTRNAQFLTLRTQPVNQFGVTTSFATQAGKAPTMAFSYDLTSPSLNQIADFQIPENGGGAPITHDELFSLQGDASYETGSDFLKSIQLGVRHTDRKKDYTQRTQFGFIDPAARTTIPDNLLLDPVRFSNGFSGLPSTLAIDIFPAVEQLFGAIDPQTSDFDRRSSWEVGEKTYAGFVQGNLDFMLGSLPVSGNIGLRVVRTETDSRSTLVSQVEGQATPTLTPIKITNGFTDWLPNLNLTFKPSDKIQVRLGASRALSRPALDDLNAGFGYFNFGSPTAFGGNPLLEPFRANQLDATFEYYFDRDSALTVSAFYKDLATYIVPQITTVSIVPAPGAAPVDALFRQPVNASGGKIKGFEVLFQKAFTFLPKPFDGLGVYLNYSYTDSNITVLENDNFIGEIGLPGLSKHVGNATLYYSKAGFEARVAYRYRSHYATGLGDADRILNTAAEGVLDFQTSYDFGDGALKGLKLLFQASNLTDEAFETYYATRAQQGRYEKYGRRFMIGAGFDF